MHRSERGQAVIMITVAIPVILGALGLVTDLGWAYWRKEACRAAAQSAAIAAAVDAKASSTYTVQSNTACAAVGLSRSVPLQAGCLYAQQNGFTNGANGRHVSMAAGTSSSPVGGTSPSYWVTATVSESIAAGFSGIFGHTLTNVSASATSAVYTGSGGGCLFVLSQTASNAYLQNSDSVTTGCGLYVDSNSSTAVTLNSSSLTLNSGAGITTAGQISKNSSTITYNGGGSANTGQSPHGNPFTGLTAPSPTLPCTADPNISSTSNGSMSPGTYCGITLSSDSNFTFNPGVYIITGGNITLNSSNATATGVTFYFTSSAGTLIVNSGGLTMSPPTSGSTDGMAIWKDGSSSNITTSSINSSSVTINGVIYMPYTNLTFNSSSTPTQTTIVANTLTMNSSNITSAASSPFFTNSGASLSGVFLLQ